MHFEFVKRIIFFDGKISRLLKVFNFFVLNTKIVCVKIRVSLIEVLIIIIQSYWLLMVNIEFSDWLKLIKYQMKIIQAKDDNDKIDQTLGSKAY